MPKPNSEDPRELTVTTAQLAALLGITGAWVRELASDGTIPKDGRNAFTLGPALRGYLDHLDKRAKADRGGDATERMANLKAERMELELAKERRDLIPMEMAGEIVLFGAQIARTELSGLPARFTRDRELRQRLEAEVAAMLTRMSLAHEEAAMKVAAGESPWPDY